MNPKLVMSQGPSFLDELQHRIREVLQQSPAKDLENNLRAMLHQGFSKLDLLTREEFELQAEVLARTRRFREAVHLGFDPDPEAPRLTPSVALVSRLPVLSHPRAMAMFPDNVAMPPGSRDPDRFTRAPLHAEVELAPGIVIDVIVVHLKSRRPDYRSSDTGEDPNLYALACLRSLIRRGTEATALRVLLTDMARDKQRPRIVLGDFNDVADSVTTEIVLGEGAPLGERMFDAARLHMHQDNLRSVGFSIVHESRHSTIDHILVSQEFNPVLPNAIGEVVDVVYLNDHLNLALPEASDHGQVLARIRLYPQAGQSGNRTD